MKPLTWETAKNEGAQEVIRYIEIYISDVRVDDEARKFVQDTLEFLRKKYK